MHDVKVTLKDGRVFCGPLWYWRPAEGWFSICSEEQPNQEGKIYLEDVQEAVNFDVRTSVSVVENVDLLERALNEGWIRKL